MRQTSTNQTVPVPNIRMRVGLILAYMGSIILLSGGSVPSLPVSFFSIDKVGHFFIFGLLGIQFARLSGMVKKEHRIKRLAWAIIAVGLFGLADECRQAFNPLRTFEWADWIADLVGATFWSFLYLYVGVFRKLLEFTVTGVAKQSKNPSL